MDGDVDIAAVAAAIGEPTRARILEVLLGGAAVPAGELARAARTSRSNASGHLAVLTAAGLVSVLANGRHRYYRLASPNVAAALESLAAVARPLPVSTLREANATAALRRARTCYDHLAGRLGVAITAALVAEETLRDLDEGYELTEAGAARLQRLGVDVAASRLRKRAFARQCIDWSERRPHVAGAVGAALLTRFLDAGWVVRIPGGRAVRLTPAGEHLLAREFHFAHAPELRQETSSR